MQLSKTALRFGTIGIVNTILDFSIFMVLVHGLYLPILWSNIIAFIIAVTNSFILNRSWTFSNPAGYSLNFKSGYLRFLIGNSIGMALGTLLIYLLMPYMNVEPAKICSVGASLIWNYFYAKYFVFLSKNKK